jgi:hypothetical protein
VIGRATSGNITATALTDARGVARTVMTYPVSRLGRLSGVWAQTNADIRNGSPEVATDVAFLRFAGVAPFTLTAAPTAIRGNRTEAVTICVRDALGAPLQGVSVNFAFDLGTSGGSGSVDGVASSGVIPNVTGSDGCVIANVTTSGMQNNNGEPKITFTVTSGGLEQSAVVNIRIGELLLVANPADFFGNGDFITTLSLVDQNGVGVAGVQLVGNCTVTAPASLVLGPIAPTDANGQTRVTLSANNFNQIGSAPTATCTFRTASGTPSTTVRVTGFDFCQIFDPTQIEGCPGYVAPGRLTVSTRQTQTTPPAAGGSNPQGTISTIPAGISCSFNGANSGDCTALFRGGVTLQYVTASGVFCRWEGACSGVSPLTTATVPPNGAVVCTAVVATNAANCAGP